MAANGPITGIQQHFNLYRVREIKTQRIVSAAKFEDDISSKISSDEEDGENRRWIPPKIEAEQYRPRVPLPITIKAVIYTPDDSGLQNLLINRRGLNGAMKQADALSETYLGNFFKPRIQFIKYFLD